MSDINTLLPLNFVTEQHPECLNHALLSDLFYRARSTNETLSIENLHYYIDLVSLTRFNKIMKSTQILDSS